MSRLEMILNRSRLVEARSRCRSFRTIRKLSHEVQVVYLEEQGVVDVAAEVFSVLLMQSI